MRPILYLLLLLMMSSPMLLAQGHTPVFSDLEGDTLINELEKEFKPVNVLSYKDARDLMYRNLYNINDSVFCVYTGHKLYLDPKTSDAVAYIFRNGDANGINCEHTFPQSLGAREGNARSDMHHLFPSRVQVNSLRSNSPYGEIRDTETLRWFYKDEEMNRIPQFNIDAYSEYLKTKFEPREDHKGNVARAMFYFATIYKEQADLNYFEEQREELCKWHALDPVDEREWVNNEIIASYQSGKLNPFILDCTLAYRCYCPDDPPCIPQTNVYSSYTPPCSVSSLDSSGKVWSLQCDIPGEKNAFIYDLNGREVFRLKFESDETTAQFTADHNLPSGMYVLHLRRTDQKVLAIKKFIITSH